MSKRVFQIMLLKLYFDFFLKKKNVTGVLSFLSKLHFVLLQFVQKARQENYLFYNDKHRFQLSCSISDVITHGSPFKCLHCNHFATIDLDELIQHCKCCSSMPRPNPYKCKFVCYQCNYSAYHVVQFKGHVFQHMGEKPFKCQLCAFACTIKGNLLRHMKIQHDLRW